MPGSGEGNQPGQQSQPTWEMPEAGGGSAGGQQQPPGGAEESWESGVPGGSGDGWETSNQVPGGDPSNIPPMPSERGMPPGESTGNPVDGELNKALEDFDGEILAERAVIQARSNETAGQSGTPTSGLPSPGGAGDAQPEVAGVPDANSEYVPRGIPRQTTSQATPMGGTSTQVPDDIPDARDDDIIARQLREAAMNEPDPELREKLWEEYRRYKGA
jgi:hypothetical protein